MVLQTVFQCKENIFICSDGANKLPVQNKLDKDVLLTNCQ